MIFKLIKLLEICVYVSIAVLFLTKSSRRTFSQYLPFQSLSSNARVGHERCSRFIKITTKTKVNFCSILDRFEQITPCLSIFIAFHKKQVNVQYGISSISMAIASHIHNTANTSLQRTTAKATSKNLRFSFLENHRVR